MKKLSIIQQVTDQAGREERPRYLELGEIEVNDDGDVRFRLFRALSVNEWLSVVSVDDLVRLYPLTSYRPKKG